LFFGQTANGADATPPAIGHYGTRKELADAPTELGGKCVAPCRFRRNPNGDSRLGRNE